jgi:hypothetical protein
MSFIEFNKELINIDKVYTISIEENSDWVEDSKENFGGKFVLNGTWTVYLRGTHILKMETFESEKKARNRFNQLKREL